MKSLVTSDLISVVLLIIGLFILADWMFGGWAGKAKYFLTEIILLFSTIAYIKLRGLNVRLLLRWKSIKAGRWLSILILSLSSAVLLDESDRIMRALMSVPSEFTESIKDSFHAESAGDIFWLLLAVGVTAPWVEESIFRGFFQRFIESKTSPFGAIMVTAIMFAIIHLQPYWFIQLVILSLIAGYCAWRLDSILPAVAIHSANNIWSLILLNDMPLNLKSIYLWKGHVNVILILLSLLGFVFSLLRFKRV